jgi:hypothetical protein
VEITFARNAGLIGQKATTVLLPNRKFPEEKKIIAL